jgi:hypothetical protein
MIKSHITQAGPSRRAFLRNTALGGLAALTATLVARQGSQVCVNNGLCRGCAEFDDCGLPQALSAKEALKNKDGLKTRVANR